MAISGFISNRGDGGDPYDPYAEIDPAQLKRQLKRAERWRRMRAFLLVSPLLLFIVVTFLAPITAMLGRSVDNSIVPETLPLTVAALKDWDETAGELPGEETFAAMVADLKAARAIRRDAEVGRRLNFDTSGFASLFRKSGRRAQRIEEGPYKDALLAIDKDWGDIETWATIKRFSGESTDGYFLAAADLERTPSGEVQFKPEDDRILLFLFQRTLILSVVITFMTILLGYPIAYLLATLPLRTSNLLMILVLLPFWTSLLVRTSAWIVLLQQQGVVNDALVVTGLNTVILAIGSVFGSIETSSLCRIDMEQLRNLGAPFLNVLTTRAETGTLSLCAQEVLAALNSGGEAAALAKGEELYNDAQGGYYGDERFSLIFNQFGTVIAMTHILLPFMVLPLYSVMKTIPPSYVRAAKSLGAKNWTAFWRIYFPNTTPGIAAGSLLVFILAIGYYITPELVGGSDGTFISNRIAYFIRERIEMASALGALLLGLVLVLYFLYARLVGVNNMKLG